MKLNGYERRTKAKKESIVNAARKLFTTRGITDVSIKEIAAKANVSQVTIYNYFGSKNALAKEVLISYLDMAIKEYEEILDRDIPFTEKLKIIMDKKYDVVNEVSRSHFSKYAWEDKTLQQVYKEVATVKAVSLYTKFIEQGKKEGAIDSSIPDDAILTFIFSSVDIMQHSDYLKTTPEYKIGILKLFLYGLLG
jgi:AcrR family transcriptional regulator